MTETEVLTAARVPTVYFIDDSATMREVIKIAFRKENIRVITCPDAASALSQFGDAAPDAVITDVIMPDKDGYEVCQFIKQHDQFGGTPVILMSGVVDRTVAEKATAVKADELIRKPFQPHELIARVKSLLNPKPSGANGADLAAAAHPPASERGSSQILTTLFTPPATQKASATAAPLRSNAPASADPASRPSIAASTFHATRTSSAPAVSPSSEIQKLRNEVRRLELLVKKLQAELDAEHQYCAGLEDYFRKLQET
jgi:DNA-binding response OmpR family regulator